jgi:RecA-family ATPase
MADDLEGWDEREAEERRKQLRTRGFDDEPPEGCRVLPIPDAPISGSDRFDDPDHKTVSFNGTGEVAKQPPVLTRLDLARYDHEPIPDRDWGVRDRFPRRNVALLSGEGGIGKSIQLLQLGAAHVLGRDWLRSLPEQGPVVAVNCEDEGDELVRRLDPILKHYHVGFGDVASDLHIFSLADRDPLLAARARSGRIVATPLYQALLEKVREVRPICTIIDNVADVFGGSEIDRSEVRQFVALMRQLALEANGYVIMSAHPSLSGIASKSGLSGSTQWHNSVRARGYLHTEKAEDDATGTRVLEFMKSNYSALSERVELQWSNGLFVPVRAPSGPEQAARNAAVETLFLELLDRSAAKGDNLSPKRNANNFAPTLFAAAVQSKAAKVTSDHFADALDRLITAGKIAVEPYGPVSRRAIRIVRMRFQ